VNAPANPTTSLAIFLGVIAAQRIGELWLSRRNARRVRALGAREFGARHFPLLVAVHVLFLASLAAEVLYLGARPGRAWPLWLAIWLAAQALRYAAIRALGERWNVRILVVPGMPRIRSGPYRFLRHPNYAAVTVELIAAALLFGAWRTALASTVANALALRVRIRAEERALAEVEALPRGPDSVTLEVP
jgi:methyltransferase